MMMMINKMINPVHKFKEKVYELKSEKEIKLKT
jgi:hypothetical protein